MNDNVYERELTVALAAVRQAMMLSGNVAQAISPALSKRDKSPVTVADFGSQALICRALGQAFGDDPIIAEEDSTALRRDEQAGLLAQVVAEVHRIEARGSADEVCRWIDRGGARNASDRFWALDPIDGTKGFLRRQQYAIALALIVEGRPVVAVLACPNFPRADGRIGAIFTAIQGREARVHPPVASGSSSVIHVSDTAVTQVARFCESYESGHSSQNDSQRIAKFLNIAHEPIRMDSQAKYAMVARGGADIYLRFPVSADYIENIWDHAAGVLVAQQAGGTVSDLAGKAIDFTQGAKLRANRGIVVTNGRLHGAVLAAIETMNIG